MPTAARAQLSLASNDPNGFLPFFTDGQARFQDVENVSGAANVGLGPRFNSNQLQFMPRPTCDWRDRCRHQSPIPRSPATESRPEDSTPSFITANGPTREARFPFFFNANGTANTSDPNGGVEDLFTVTGRTDAGSCSLQQPSFAAAQQANNIIFRIPTPVFGAGLIENLDDSTLLTNQANNLNNNLGIAGTFNHNGNDGTISRFGWKAQNKSLHIFAGEAYNVEMGITNLLFPQDRPLPGRTQLRYRPHGLPANCLNLSRKGLSGRHLQPNADVERGGSG